jgi:hypothetical protein
VINLIPVQAERGDSKAGEGSSLPVYNDSLMAKIFRFMSGNHPAPGGFCLPFILSYV